jgi:hypothetical protein
MIIASTGETTFKPDGTNTVMQVKTSAVTLPSDTTKLYFGAGDDATINYDGTNLVVNPKLVGSGGVNITGSLSADSEIKLNYSGSVALTIGINPDEEIPQLVPAGINPVLIKNGLYIVGASGRTTTTNTLFDPSLAKSIVSQYEYNNNLYKIYSGTAGTKTLFQMPLESASLNTGGLSATSAKFGSATDYTSFEADGTLSMTGSATVWEDLNFDPARSAGPVATRPAEVTIDNCYYVEFASTNNQSCGSTAELPHEYKLSSTLYPHAHVFLKSGETSGTTGVEFTVYWRLSQNSGTTTGSTTLSASSAQLNSTSGANKLDLYNTSFAGSAELGGQLALTIARTGGDAGDIVVTTYGCHYEISQLGSRTITTI